MSGFQQLASEVDDSRIFASGEIAVKEETVENGRNDARVSNHDN